MIAPISSFATPALSGIAARGFTAMRMGGGEYKPWDVKQEGGQMDSGWGTGERLPLETCHRFLAQIIVLIL